MRCSCNRYTTRDLYFWEHDQFDKAFVFLTTNEKGHQILEPKKSKINETLDELKKAIGDEHWERVFLGKKNHKYVPEHLGVRPKTR